MESRSEEPKRTNPVQIKISSWETSEQHKNRCNKQNRTSLDDFCRSHENISSTAFKSSFVLTLLLFLSGAIADCGSKAFWKEILEHSTSSVGVH